MSDPTTEDFTEMINQARDAWSHAMGLQFVRVTREEVVGELEVWPVHLQAYGVVHGGVHAGVLETLASVGAAVNAMARGQTVVGLENHTSFVRAVRGGRLRATVVPLTRGRRSQLWEGRIVDDANHLIATGRVRLLCLEPGAELAGTPAALQTREG